MKKPQKPRPQSRRPNRSHRFVTSVSVILKLINVMIRNHERSKKDMKDATKDVVRWRRKGMVLQRRIAAGEITRRTKIPYVFITKK